MADVALKITQALLQYVTGGIEKIMELELYLTIVCRFTDDVAKAVAQAAMKKGKVYITEELWATVADVAAEASGPKSSTKKTNSKRNSLGGP